MAKSAKKSMKKSAKKSAKKSSTKKNKLGVKNSLVNNINAKKKKGESRSKKKSTVSKNNITIWKMTGEKRNSIFTFNERAFAYYFRD
jgi:hypothetical protein